MAPNSLSAFNYSPGTFKLAGFNLDPAVIGKFGWNKTKPTPTVGVFNSLAQEDSGLNDVISNYGKYAQIAKNFANPPVDLSKLDADSRGLVAVSQILQPNVGQTIATGLMQRDAALEAQKMQRENYEYLSEKALQKERRQGVRDLFNTIGNAFSPIPSERTQELAANIANISNPRNLSPQVPLQTAPYGVATRQYFS